MNATMIRIERNAKMEAAINRCRKFHPKVTRLDAARVQVYGHNNTYTVTLAEPKPGLKLAHCTCPAGESGQLCYHVAAAHHAPALPAPPTQRQTVSDRQQRERERANAILVKPQPSGLKYGGIDV